jgi:DNA invertase Pin-like site-specific DNA recombinase
MNALTNPEVAEIAAKVGRPRSTNNGKIALDVERIRAMRKAGFSWRQVADYLEVGVSTVRRRVTEADASRYRTPIPTRTETDKRSDLPSWWPLAPR